jgi:hypothetical protein
MADVNPYLVNDENAPGIELTHLPTDETFNEDWLQRLLFNHPKILPVEQLDEAFAPLISIGREIDSIDNLFISPNGLLTIVETKLWRNSEAHRTVVAQILDYTRRLSNYTYDKLDQQVSKCMNKQNICTCIEKAGYKLNVDTIEFQAKVQDGLTNGKFILLIVGDKIFPEATQLAEIIQSAPHLQFKMGFVELRCFKLEKDNKWPLIVVPHFVAETNEITRAVVRVIYDPKTPPIVTVEAPPAVVSRSSSGSGRRTEHTNPIVFAASLPSNIQDIFKSYIERWLDAGYTLSCGSVSLSLNIKWKGELTSLCIFFLDEASIITEKLAREGDFPSEIYKKYKNGLLKSHILGNLLTKGKMYIHYNEMTVEDIELLLSSADMFASELSKFSNS